MTKVAVIEDNSTMRSVLTEIVNKAPGYHESGIACTARLTQKMPALQIIMVTVYKDTDLIFQALKAGACGYILKRFRPQQIIDAIAEVRAGGAPMTSEVARMVVRSFQGTTSESDSAGLTARESEILMLLAEGLSNKEIAHKANISAGTVRIHLGHIFKKLHVRCRTEAAAKYLRAK
jgi:DNA-binding NarL/FixJ family response regulator